MEKQSKVFAITQGDFICAPLSWVLRYLILVDITGRQTLGMCQDYLPRNQRNRPSVLSGFWAFGQYIESGYVVFGPKKTHLLPGPKLGKIGIFFFFNWVRFPFTMWMTGLSCIVSVILLPKPCGLTSTLGTDSEPLKILSVDDER